MAGSELFAPGYRKLQPGHETKAIILKHEKNVYAVR